MAQAVGTLASTLANRVRDPNMTATPQAFYIQVLSQCQQIVNAGLDAVIANTTVTTTPHGKLYQISAILPACLRVVGVRDAFNRDLDPIEYGQLPLISRTWFRDVGDEYLSYATIGRDLLVLYPAIESASTITVYYTQITPTLVLPTDQTVLPDDLDQITLDLAECVMLMKMQEFDDASIQSALQRFKTRMMMNQTDQKPRISTTTKMADTSSMS